MAREISQPAGRRVKSGFGPTATRIESMNGRGNNGRSQRMSEPHMNVEGAGTRAPPRLVIDCHSHTETVDGSGQPAARSSRRC